ncbi:uncharacterized protein METZ01_LOCUS297455 [marine metagenome]|uniref:Uncharacterized protein n=1 Tax=marine metagenome TaxID=408172 RepID=A0A382MBH4_9ZZZZ
MVRQTGWASTGRFVVVSIRMNPDDRATRVGFIVSKRIGNAVCRNRTRRRLREIYRKNRQEFSPAIWMVVIARRSVTKASHRDLEQDLINTYIDVKRNYPCL